MIFTYNALKYAFKINIYGYSCIKAKVFVSLCQK